MSVLPPLYVNSAGTVYLDQTQLQAAVALTSGSIGRGFGRFNCSLCEGDGGGSVRGVEIRLLVCFVYQGRCLGHGRGWQRGPLLWGLHGDHPLVRFAVGVGGGST